VISIRRYLILVGMMAGLQVLSAGQSQPTPDSPSQGQAGNDSAARTAPAPALTGIVGIEGEDATQNAASSLPQIPSLLGGVGISSTFLSDMEKSNYLRAGLNVGAVYDDNPLLLPAGAVSNTSESIFPSIKIDETTSRMHWTLGYAGGLTINQKLTSQNEGSHDVNFDSQFRLSPHLNLRIAENFSLTTGLFDAGSGDSGVGTGGTNPGLITPLATQRSNLTTVEINYHFALNDLVGASGSFSDLHFSNEGQAPGTTQPTVLANTQTATGSAFWLHRIFGRDWGGITYRFDRITFDPNDESRVHSFLAVDTWNLSNRYTLTGFVGPQYSENQGVSVAGVLPPQTTNWSVAGGVEGSWKTAHNSLSAGFVRSISNGGGVLGAVRLQNLHANFRREFIPGWAVGLTASHGTNDSITLPPPGSASSINLTSAGATLEHNVGKSLGIRMGYSHDFQQQYGLPAPNPTLDASRNRFFVTLSYQWAKPLGM
jgi:hypothetical protein